ncbi:MAG TPA: hypothetical protein VIP70_13370 [Nitrososphaeraceae archaeon]
MKIVVKESGNTTIWGTVQQQIYYYLVIIIETHYNGSEKNLLG